MRKSIFKVTGWSVVLAGGLFFVLLKKQDVSIAKVQSTVSSTNEDVNSSSNNADYTNNTPQQSTYNNPENNLTTPNYSTPSQSVSNTEIAQAPNMGVNQSQESNEVYQLQDINQDAVAKGGPNSNNQSFNNSSSNNSVSTSTITGGVNSVATPNNTARVNAPTVVTAPAAPGGSGGSSGGDPFVPIDDYYGLIFLIAISTIIGIFTIKKTRLV